MFNTEKGEHMSQLNRGVRRCCVALGGGLLLLASPAMAQQAETDLDSIIDASASPERAIALARTQEDAGDLLGAAATLERALFRGSVAATASARLHYVGLLCKLGDRPRATTELAKLDGIGASDADWAATQSACGDLPRPAGRGSAALFSGQASVGMAYDSDALGALSVQFALPGVPGIRDDGFSFIGSFDLAGRIPTGSNFFYGQLAAQTKNSVAGADLDYQLGDLQLGYGIAAGKVELSGGFFGRYGRIAGSYFVGEYGGAARAAVPVSARSRIGLEGVVVHQSYAGSTALFSRDGTRYDLALDFQGSAANGVNYALGAAFEDKTADTRQLGYTGARVFGAVQVPLSTHGTYGALSATIRHVAFRAPAAGARQIETRYFVRAALGVPLAERLTIETAVSYTARDYNAASSLVDYHSVGGELRLVWNFGE